MIVFFVLPEYIGKGIGKKIMNALENDEYFLKSKRIEITSSITALGFYKKLGYKHKNGNKYLDEIEKNISYKNLENYNLLIKFKIIFYKVITIVKYI